MASGFYDSGLRKLADRTIDFVGDAQIRVLLVDAAYTFDKTQNFVSQAVARETTASGYTGGYAGAGRQVLATKSISLDGTNHRVKWNAATVTWTGLGGAVVVGGAIVFKKGTSDDTDAQMLFFFDAADLTTNGSDISLAWDATNGAAYLQN